MEKCKKQKKTMEKREGKGGFSIRVTQTPKETTGPLPKAPPRGPLPRGQSRFFTGCRALFFRMEKEN